MSKYLVQKSDEKDYLICTDTENKLVVKWKKGAFNQDQKFTLLEDADLDALAIAKIAREIGDFLAENHPDKV